MYDRRRNVSRRRRRAGRKHLNNCIYYIITIVDEREVIRKSTGGRLCVRRLEFVLDTLTANRNRFKIYRRRNTQYIYRGRYTTA